MLPQSGELGEHCEEILILRRMQLSFVPHLSRRLAARVLSSFRAYRRTTAYWVHDPTRSSSAFHEILRSLCSKKVSDHDVENLEGEHIDRS
jgi:hypothetical protein